MFHTNKTSEEDRFHFAVTTSRYIRYLFTEDPFPRGARSTLQTACATPEADRTKLSLPGQWPAGPVTHPGLHSRH
jgi:hypothetical protein